MTEEEYLEVLNVYETAIIRKYESGEISMDDALFYDRKLSEWENKFYEEAE